MGAKYRAASAAHVQTDHGFDENHALARIELVRAGQKRPPLARSWPDWLVHSVTSVGARPHAAAPDRARMKALRIMGRAPGSVRVTLAVVIFAAADPPQKATGHEHA